MASMQCYKTCQEVCHEKSHGYKDNHHGTHGMNGTVGMASHGMAGHGMNGHHHSGHHTLAKPFQTHMHSQSHHMAATHGHGHSGHHTSSSHGMMGMGMTSCYGKKEKKKHSECGKKKEKNLFKKKNKSGNSSCSSGSDSD